MWENPVGSFLGELEDLALLCESPPLKKNGSLLVIPLDGGDVIVELDDGMLYSDSDHQAQVWLLQSTSQVPLEMRVMLKYYGIVQVDEPLPHHLDHLEMPMIPSR